MSNAITPTPAEERHPVPPAPIHPLAALTTIVLDNLFTLPEIAGPEVWIITIPLIGGLGFVATTLVQRYLAKDSWGEAIAKGVVMGIIAGVPTSVTGTTVGVVLLSWAGANKWIKLPGLKRPEQLPPEEEIVDGEVKDIGQNI